MCRGILEGAGRELDFDRAHEPAFWPEVEREVGEILLEAGPAYETVVVDEGQDFEPEWYEILRLCMTEDADILWVEDPLQNVGDRSPVEMEGAVVYRTDENHRSPRSITREIRDRLGIGCTSANDLPGDPVQYHTYVDPDEQPALVGERLKELAGLGYRPQDIVVLTVHGFWKSLFAQARSVSEWPLRRLTGQYTDDGHQIFAQGQVLFDSVWRFKGQQAPAIILTDVDFADWREQRARRTLYTGMTRARRHLEVLTTAPT